MHGKTVLVTGATSGIGEVTARVLAQKGARVILVGRSAERGQAALGRIRLAYPESRVHLLLADLSVQSEIRKLADQVLEIAPKLDVLINNAGAFFFSRQESPDGIEMTWATNHLSYFLLTHLLLPTLYQAAEVTGDARIVTVASNMHKSGKIRFNNLQGRGFYWGLGAYAQSKLANVLFTFELARRLKNSGVTANALHPGFVATQIGSNNGWLINLVWKLSQRRAISIEEGAKTSIYLATSPSVKGISGKYFIREKEASASDAAYDLVSAKKLWQISAEMAGIKTTGLDS